MFAETLLKSQFCGRPFGLVPCAIGASCIDEWLPGTPNFKQMVRHPYSFAAQAALRASGFTKLGAAGLCNACQLRSSMCGQPACEDPEDCWECFPVI